MFALSELPISSATASSAYSKYYAASKSIDKNISTYWRGAYYNSYYWLQFDLGQTKTLNQISIWWNKTYGSTNYSIQGSNNNSTWTNILTGQSSAGGSVNPYQKNHTISGSYRYVRIYISRRQSYYPIIYEVKLFGPDMDTTPPTGSIKINNDVPYANSVSVGLRLSAQDNTGGSGLSQMQFSNDNIVWSAPEIYATTKSWTLASGDGNKTVYVKYKDIAGNWSQGYSDTIILDTTPPAIIITSPKNGSVVGDSTVKLQGTVDGVVFSEDRTLNLGENTLTKTATDAAGNSASASITVYFGSGSTVGPAGGVVSSSDGKVRLIIPAGALSASTYISIDSPKQQELQNSAPAGQTLVCAAEFKPLSLVFNTPVQLIYTLSQPEVPGTPLQLGLYNSKTNKVEPTGQFSVVDEDSYTVRFMLNHFSTYGVLKGSTTSGAPIGSGVDIPLPDMFTGAFSHSVPLTVVPGRKKMQPNLALTYRSSNANSWLGVGFSLNPGYIVRSTRMAPPSYDDNQDTFYFVNDSGSTELVHLVDNLYQAKIESSFTKFYKEADDSWRAVEKNGMSLTFGKTAAAKELGSGGTFSWYVSEAFDTNGNYVSYHYSQDQGKSYLDYIEYTGNKNTSTSATNRVEFYLEPRNDVSSTYISGRMITTAKRLHEIKVKQLGVLVWRYELGYEYSPDTGRSLLKTVTQYAADGTAFPTQMFSYQASQ